jgi:hypothetical protein
MVLYVVISVKVQGGEIDKKGLSIYSVITFTFVFGLGYAFGGGCSKPQNTNSESNVVKKESNYINVHLVCSGEIVKVPKAEFVGTDTIFVKLSAYEDMGLYVFRNDAKRNLVMYTVKYTKNGYGNGDKIVGSLIFPDEYFTWEPRNENHRMFEKPPTSKTIVTHHKQYQLDALYLTFLDYADSAPNYVSIEKRNKKHKNTKK